MLLPCSAASSVRLVAARLRVEPVALQDAVVERRVGVDVRGEHLVVGVERGGAVGLVAVGRENGAVLAVGQRHLRPGRQLDGRVLDVGGRERRVGVVGRGGEAARQRQQVLALLVEHVLLLAVEILEREAVHRQGRLRVHPRLDGRQRNRQQLRIEPRARLAGLREQDLDLLAPGVDLVVALILVVLQAREVPHLVGELADVVGQLHRGEQAVGALRERALQRGVGGDLGLELVVAALPRLPAGEDVVEVPLVAVVNRGAVAKLGRSRGLGGREQVHLSIISRCATGGDRRVHIFPEGAATRA